MSDYIEVTACLEYILDKIEDKDALHITTEEEVDQIQSFDVSDVKTVLVKETPLAENTTIKAKDVYIETEEAYVEESEVPVKTEGIPEEIEKVNEVQRFDLNNIRKIVVEETPLAENTSTKARVYIEREQVHVEGAATSKKPEEVIATEKVSHVQKFNWDKIKTILVKEKPLKVEAPVEGKSAPFNCEDNPAEGADAVVKEGTAVGEERKKTPEEGEYVDDIIQHFVSPQLKAILAKDAVKLPVEGEEEAVEANQLPEKGEEETAEAIQLPEQEATAEANKLPEEKEEEATAEAKQLTGEKEEATAEANKLPEEKGEEANVEANQQPEEEEVSTDVENVHSVSEGREETEREEFEHFKWMFAARKIYVKERKLDQCKVNLQFGDDNVDHLKEFIKGSYTLSSGSLNKLQNKIDDLEENEMTNQHKNTNNEDQVLASREYFRRPRTGPPLLQLNKLSCQPRHSRSQNKMFFGVTWGYHADVDPALLWKDPLELLLEDFEESDNVVYTPPKTTTNHHAMPDVDYVEVVDVGTGGGEMTKDIKLKANTHTQSSQPDTNHKITEAIQVDCMSPKKIPQGKTTTPKSSSYKGIWKKMKKFFRGNK